MGFFTQSELAKTAAIELDIDQLRSDCPSCGLYEGCRNPKLEYEGKGKRGILIVGEFPTEADDKYGVPFAEEEGEVLQKALKKQGISLNNDCWRTYAVRCCPQGKKFPTSSQALSCKPFLEKLIYTLKPKHILAFGNSAITALFGDDFSDREIERWRGYTIPDEKFNCNITPLYSPSYVLSKYNDRNLRTMFDRDLERALKRIDKPFKERLNYENRVEILLDFNSVENVLKRVLRVKPKLAFDYETTGLKPFQKGHKIATIAFAVNTKKAYAFPYMYNDFWTEKELLRIRKLWMEILRDPAIKKIAHNAKFEDIWSRVFFRTKVKVMFDTMMAEHILDNRAVSTGLKFQSFVSFGVRPYDKSIKPFLKAADGTEFNTVERAPLKDLLIYNGMDCIFSFMKFKEQARRLNGMNGLRRAYLMFMDGCDVMADMQANGIPMNSPYYKEARRDLVKKIKKIRKRLETGREAKAFEKQVGRPIKITSNQDLGLLFYEVLGKKAVYTEKNQYKTDKKTLEGLKLPFVEELVNMKKYEKARGTYIGQFAREIVQDTNLMHPFFDLHIPVTYRGSSSKPNFQNLPKRDPEVGLIIRRGIVPEPGCVICESDFSGAEVITSATYHKDPTFIHDVTVGDMHRDLAAELFQIPVEILIDAKKNGTKEQAYRAKMIRFFTKNNWTFAQFYGDWFASCGPNLWENVVENGLQMPDGMFMRDWLEEKGIYELGKIESDKKPTPGSFLEHCKEVEKRMWEERFPLYTQWKKDVVEGYRKYGYIENHFGFRFTGYMDPKQCTNYPIQSASFHLLVYTLIRVQRYIKEHKMKTKLIGQIHDSIVANVPVGELEQYTLAVRQIVANLKNELKWLIIPMEIEVEISKQREFGGNFAQMKEIKFDKMDKWRDWYAKAA